MDPLALSEDDLEACTCLSVSFVLCSKKMHLAGVSNSSGETCHHARQCENYDHMPTSSQARTLDVEGDLTAAPDQEMGITQAHVCCSVPRLSAAHAAAPFQLRTPFRKLLTSLCHTHLRWKKDNLVNLTSLKNITVV